MLHGKVFQYVLGAVTSIAALTVNAQVVPLDSVVAIVDEDIVLSSEIRDRVQQIKASATQRGMELPDDETLIQETLDRLILESIQLQLADRYGIRIPDAQLDQSLARVAASPAANIAILTSRPRPEGRRISSLIRFVGFFKSTSLMVNAMSIDCTNLRSGASSRACLMAVLMFSSISSHLCSLRGSHLSCGS